MTDHQFECLHILLIGIANDLSAIRGHLEKQASPDVVLVGERGPELMRFTQGGEKQSVAQS